MSKISIELTEQQENFLKLFAANHYEGAPANLATCTPIHVVETQRYDYCDVSGNDYGHDIVYADLEGECVYETLQEIIEAYLEDGEDINVPIIPYEQCECKHILGIDQNSWFISDEGEYLRAYGINDVRQVCRIERYEPVAFFFIRSEAERYLSYQAHNLTKPRAYTYDLGYSNCGDMPHFRALLLDLGKKLLEGESK